MIFNSFVFVFLMLSISIAGYYLANRISNRIGLTWLLIVSLFFVGYTNYLYLVILIPDICINYLISVFMNRKKAYGKLLLCIGITFNILLLFVFKYYDFFAGSINNAISKDYVAVNLILPLGISFYTFQQITYLVDCYREGTLPCDLLEYAVYISFYPQFTQGPIVLQSEFVPQLKDPLRKKWDNEYAAKGLYRFIIGLSKKVLLADSIARAVDGGYANLWDIKGLSSVVLILGYSLQIYFDFSAYSDMAVGLGQLFHLDIPENFDSPYKAKNIDEFWDRWHITLTRFFTRYVYIPLGGSRKGTARTYCNIFLIFLLSGLWHGAEWSFVLWGIMHGLAMMISRFIRSLSGKKEAKELSGSSNILSLISRTITFIYVSIAWVFFRAADIDEGLTVIGSLLHGGWNGISEYITEPFNKLVEMAWILHLDVLHIDNKIEGIMTLIILIVLLIVCLVAGNSKEMTDKWSVGLKMGGRRVIISGIVMAVLFTWCIMSFSGVTTYIYWNF